MAPFLWTQKQDIGPSRRAGHGLVYDSARQRVVLFGGDPGGPPLGDTWRWDGTLWTQVAATGPWAAHGIGMAYDAARQTIVLFGGATGSTSFDDTWLWDGDAWTQVADTGPSPRRSHAMAYDSARGRVVLFGGGDANGPHGDTWEWDGTEWTQVQDVGPSPRSGHAMAFDPMAGRVVLFGGADGTGAGLGDTWTWDGTAWTQAADTGPHPRTASAMVAAGTVVLFGGVNSVDPALPPGDREIYGDSWRWDGNTWTMVQDIGPAPRWGHAMAFRSDAGRIVLFGGATTFGPPGDASLQPGLAQDTWEHPEAGPSPDDGLPDDGQPDPQTVDVAAVTVSPDSVTNQGDVLDVTVNLTTVTPFDTYLVAGIFFDPGDGNYQPSQPPGFTMPPQPIGVPAGVSETQFQIVRDGDPLPVGTYAIAVGIDGGGGMQAGFFTVT